MHRDLPIVIVSGPRAAELARKHAKDSCLAALTRPYTAEELQETLRALRVRRRGGD
jgi:hypothetical protein